jgi:hypothetical protein
MFAELRVQVREERVAIVPARSNVAVIAGLDPAIHRAQESAFAKMMDTRAKPA